MPASPISDDQAFRDISVGLARFHIKSRHGEEFAGYFNPVTTIAVPNPDKLQFEFYRHPSGPTKFLLYQTFRNAAAWETHRTLPETRTSFLATQPTFDRDPERSFWNPVFLGHAIEAVTEPVGFVSLSTFNVQPAHRDQLLERIRIEMERQRAVSKLVRTDLSQSVDDPLRLLLFSRWPDHQTWEASRSESDHAAYAAELMKLVDDSAREQWVSSTAG